MSNLWGKQIQMPPDMTDKGTNSYRRENYANSLLR